MMLIVRKIKHKLLVLLLFYSVQVVAQKNIQSQHQIWYGYYVQTTLSKRWSALLEIHERHFVSPNVQQQFLMRGVVNAKLNANWEIGLGKIVSWATPNNPYASLRLTIPELRQFIEINYRTKLSHLGLDHRYWFETRFFGNTNEAGTARSSGFHFNNVRARYRLQALLPLWTSKDENQTLQLKVSDEILLNISKKIVYNVFDSNRLYIGFLYKISPQISLDAGYMNLFQQQASGDDFYGRHVFRFNLIHKLRFEKTKH